jgi:hypothetical protein
MTWTREASAARCWSGTPTAAGRHCQRRAWRRTGWRRSSCPDEHVNWQVWAEAGRGRGLLWRTFLAEQRALLRKLGELECARRVPEVVAEAIVAFVAAVGHSGSPQ